MNAAEEQKMPFLPLSASTCQGRCFSKAGPSESALQMFAGQAAFAAEASPTKEGILKEKQQHSHWKPSPFP